MNVLVIEDNRDIARILSDILKIKGCETEIAFTAKVGLEIAEQSKPDLIFCDIGLPGEMNGHDFARSLRAHPALGSVPLIAVSGYATEEDRRQALDSGFDMVFPKPVKFADLTTALEHFAGGAKS